MARAFAIARERAEQNGEGAARVIDLLLTNSYATPSIFLIKKSQKTVLFFWGSHRIQNINLSQSSQVPMSPLAGGRGGLANLPPGEIRILSLPQIFSDNPLFLLRGSSSLAKLGRYRHFQPHCPPQCTSTGLHTPSRGGIFEASPRQVWAGRQVGPSPRQVWAAAWAARIPLGPE